MENIQNLESEIRELGKKCDLESVLREELSLEIQALQRSQSKISWNIQPIPQETEQIPAQLESGQCGSLSSIQMMSTSRSGTSPLPSIYPIQTTVQGVVENTALTTTHKEQSSVTTQTAYQPSTSVKYSIEGPIISEIALPLDIDGSVSNSSQSKVDPSAPMKTTN
ncbi:hypothetical protein X975_21819, partial [Stegodyphus mimosarum]